MDTFTSTHNLVADHLNHSCYHVTVSEMVAIQ